MVHPQRSSMPCCLVVSLLVILAAPTSSFHAAASSSNSRAHRTPTLRWKQRGVRALLQTPVTVNSSNGTGPPTSYTTSVAPSGAVIININNNNNNNNNNAPNAVNNNANNNGNGNASPSPSPSSNPSPSGDGSVVPLATGGSSPPPSNNNNNNNNNNNANGNTGALPSGAPPVQQGTTVTQGSSAQCDINGPNCCSDQGQNSRLLPVNSAASLSSIVTSIYDAVPGGATYSPPSSVSLGYGVSNGANGRIAVKSGSRGLDAFEAAVLALNLPASSAGVNYQFNQGTFICVPNLYSSAGAPILVQPTVYNNGFNNAGVIPGGAASGATSTSGNGGYGQNAYGGNPYGTRYPG